MKLIVTAVAFIVVASLALAPAPASAAQAKGKSTGTVTAIGADSVTMNVAGKDMAFKIDAKTAVVARGAGTSAKAAKKEGGKGPKFGDVVRVGDEIEVSYNTVAGSMVATNVRVTKKAGK